MREKHEKNQPFEGIRVVDFGWVFAGPTISRQLAWHGATVVRVESHKKPDLARTAAPFKEGTPGLDRAAFFATVNADKYDISLDITRPKGRDVAYRLIRWADIVTEGFAPGAMKNLELDYETVREIKPDIIYVSTSQEGETGPHAQFKGTGAMSSSLAGYTHLTGYPDRDPTGVFGGITDVITPCYSVIGIIGALLRRKRTGKGMHIDASQLESGVTFLAQPMLDYSVNGRIWDRMENRHAQAAPHGAFPCKGEDSWCVIGVLPTMSGRPCATLWAIPNGPRIQSLPLFQ